MERATIKMFIDQCIALDLHGAADCIENLAAEVQHAEMESVCAKREAAASQTRERQLREALELMGRDKWHWEQIRDKAIAIPQDTSALEALIAKAGEVMQERCAHEADPFELKNALATDIAKGIRALPGVTLEDLQK